MSSFDLSGKNIVVTGGGKGIGKSIAEIFHFHGASVFIIDNDLQAADDTAHRLRKQGGQAEALQCDVSSQNQVTFAFEKIISSSKTIDVLVNSAGIAHIGTLETTTEETLDRLYNVNIKGIYHCMQAAIIPMKKQKHGVILNLCSIAATTGIENRFAYSMTKGAVLSMSLSVARDFIKDNIRVNCISPARVHTPFVDGFIKANYKGQEEEMFKKLSEAQPLGRMGKPEEVASLALYLCSDEASFVTGANYNIDGGFTSLK